MLRGLNRKRSSKASEQQKLRLAAEAITIEVTPAEEQHENSSTFEGQEEDQQRVEEEGEKERIDSHNSHEQQRKGVTVSEERLRESKVKSTERKRESKVKIGEIGRAEEDFSLGETCSSRRDKGKRQFTI